MDADKTQELITHLEAFLGFLEARADCHAYQVQRTIMSLKAESGAAKTDSADSVQTRNNLSARRSGRNQN
jgi:hypothetical protein